MTTTTITDPILRSDNLDPAEQQFIEQDSTDLLGPALADINEGRSQVHHSTESFLRSLSDRD